jgi:hypothetical protein
MAHRLGNGPDHVAHRRDNLLDGLLHRSQHWSRKRSDHREATDGAPEAAAFPLDPAGLFFGLFAGLWGVAVVAAGLRGRFRRLPPPRPAVSLIVRGILGAALRCNPSPTDARIEGP